MLRFDAFFTPLLILDDAAMSLPLYFERH